VQQLEQNIVFFAKARHDCGFVQKMAQHMVLCAISSMHWAEANN
jgi:hypothetical protein